MKYKLTENEIKSLQFCNSFRNAPPIKYEEIVERCLDDKIVNLINYRMDRNHGMINGKTLEQLSDESIDNIKLNFVTNLYNGYIEYMKINKWEDYDNWDNFKTFIKNKHLNSISKEKRLNFLRDIFYISIQYLDNDREFNEVEHIYFKSLTDSIINELKIRTEKMNNKENFWIPIEKIVELKEDDMNVRIKIKCDQNIISNQYRNYEFIEFINKFPKWDEDAYMRVVKTESKAWADIKDPVAWVNELRGSDN